MAEIDINRCMTVAAFSAFVRIREHLAKNTSLDAASAVASLRQINADSTGLDYVGGIAIHGLLDDQVQWIDPHSGLRLVIGELVKISQPWWLRLVPYGRDKVRSALDVDQAQCFREAGLFDPVPTPEVIAWWDEVAATMRGAINAERMIRAREAERLSLEHERDRLKRLGIGHEPEWVSLEDNTLGYDIRSYDLNGGEVVTRLVEAKSTTSDSIFITRNEWQNAAGAETQYVFQVWKLPERAFAEYSVSAIRPCIPIDQGFGRWQKVLVAL
jgi:Protein NO VEIN, C-terminal